MSEDKNKPVLDEQTLAKLLEAAYVLQEHNRDLGELELCLELKRDQVEAEDRAAAAAAKSAKTSSSSSKTAPGDYTLTLAQIVETQHHIQVRHLELENAMALVTERVVEIARASGAAVGIIEGKNVQYRAVAGVKTLPHGTTVPLAESLSISCLKTGQVLRCADVNPEFLLDTEECRRRGIESMIAVPVFHDGAVVGGLEVYYSAKNAFTEQDVHTCQLMAGLVTEALARAEELTWKKSLATERAAMLEALEKLKPNLAALIGQPTAKDTATKTTSSSSSAPAAETCGKCGHKIVGEEQFCGQCGSPRSSDYEPPSMQSKVASLWQMQEARKKDASAESPNSEDLPEELPDLDELWAQAPLADSIEDKLPELFTPSDVPISNASPSAKSPVELLNPELEGDIAEEPQDPPKASEEVSPSDPVALAKPAHSGHWSSAASAREFLEQLASANRSSSLVRLWNTRRGDIYLAIAVILVACVIRWGVWSSHSVTATAAPNAAAAAHRKPPEADLSLFDRMLIQLGLAEPPDTPEDKGNPSVQVWVDTHTALYYCPGADLYGKTAKGKLTTQREAQLDQFQPAYRKACN